MKRSGFSLTTLLFLIAFILLLFGFGLATYRSAHRVKVAPAELKEGKVIEKFERIENK